MQMMKYLILLVALLLPAPALATIEKIAIPSDNGFDFYWWPDLPRIDGWHQDKDSSYEYGANTQAPDGATFSDAETVIYAKALYKARMPKTRSLEQFIDDDIQDFKETQPDMKIEKGEPVRTKTNIVMTTYRFYVDDEGNWERVAYGEEGEFYLVFTLSSRTETGFKKNLPIFEKFIRNYE